jgi:peptide/nickel transport system substrate-binding protein
VTPGWRGGTRVAGLIVACVLSACGVPPPSSIRVGIPIAPVTLDPHRATDAMSVRLLRLLHRGLVELDASARPRPALADWIALTPTHYRFTLRADARFADARAITAADVVATYSALRDPLYGSPHRAALAGVSAVTARDARTIDITLRAPDASFPGVLDYAIVAAADAHTPGPRAGAGPFVAARRSPSGGTRLRRRSDGTVIDFVVVRDATVRALKLVAGELDLAQGNLPPDIVDWLAHQPDLRVLRRAGSTFAYLGFNLRRGPSAARAVRAAVAHAIDRAAIVRYLFHTQARPAASLLAPPHWAADADLEAPAYDPRRARQLLAQAGYGASRLTLRFKTSADPFRLRIASVLQHQLAQVGIDLVIESLDFATFYGDIGAGRFDTYALSWVALKLPNVFRLILHSSAEPPHGNNRGGYRSPRADRLIERAERASEPQVARPFLQQLQREVLNDLPFVPLWYEDQAAVVRADIAGYTLDADGSFDGLLTIERLTTRDAH